MTGIWALLKKDFTSHFRSWVGVFVLFAFLFVAGIFFTLFLLSYSQLSFEAARQSFEGVQGLSLTRLVSGVFLLNLGVLFLFLAPMLSMRSFAEEKKFGTLELLYTYPLSDFQIVMGKYLALASQLVCIFLPTLIYLGVIKFFGGTLELAVVFAGTLGFLLLGFLYLAIGLYFSSLTENQIIAAGLTFSSLLALWMLEWVSGLLPSPWGPAFGAFSPFFHFRDFSLGVIDLKDMIYFVCVIFFFLFLTLRTVETRNWKG